MSQSLLQPFDANNPLVYLDISIGEEFAGRMVIELRKDIVPKTSENFRCLCTGERGMGQLGKPLHYKGIRFHKVRRVFVAQSGDIVNNDGTSGESIYGPKFEDENFTLLHDEGVVSMTNYGEPNTNNSQFIITSVACDNLNGTNVVVGKVLRGLGIIGDMEQNTTDEGAPTQEIIIRDCGELQPGEDWGVCDSDETSNKIPPYPQDWEQKDANLTCTEMVEILLNIRNFGNIYFFQRKYYDALRKYRKAHRYYQLMRKRFDWQQLNQCKSNNAELKQLDSFAAVNNVNMATVEIKLGEHSNAIYFATEAIQLDPDCAKAYFRRGQAHIALHNYEEAIADLKRAYESLQDGKQILNELNRAKKLLADYNREQMNALKNLFS